MAAGRSAEPVRGSRRGALPSVIQAELATLVMEAPAGNLWMHEARLDGYRILALIRGGKACLISRNGKDWTDRFPSIAGYTDPECARTGFGNRACGA
jgi:bifunctional non-homologous end joining protein LigD